MLIFQGVTVFPGVPGIPPWWKYPILQESIASVADSVVESIRSEEVTSATWFLEKLQLSHEKYGPPGCLGCIGDEGIIS